VIANYGYSDASGEYLITIDTDRCDGCGLCKEVCPAGVMELGDDESDPLNEVKVAIVLEGQRNRIGHTCKLAGCKPGKERCIEACAQGAIEHSF